MTRAYELPEAIVWHEGMLLAPQHFQQLSRRHEMLLYYHARTVAPYHWGVRHLEFDRVMLVGGVLRVRELEAILPDGLVVSHAGGPDRADLQLDLAPFAERLKDQALTVHLVVAAHRTNGAAAGGMAARYQSHDGPRVYDETTGDGDLYIKRWRPRLSLRVDVPDQCVGFPLAKIRYQSEGYALTDYVPPMLEVRRGSPLGQLCTSVSHLLRQKATFLADQIRHPAAAMESPHVLARRAQIHSLVGGLLPFEALLDSDTAHPFALYLAFCGVAGHAAAVGHALVPPDLARYDHNDLYLTFSQIRAYIERTVHEGIQQTHLGHVFEHKETVFWLRFREEWLGHTLVLGVRASSGMTEKDVVAWVEGALIGSESRLKAMRERRVRGVARQRVDSSDGLVPGQGMVLYEIEADPEFIAPGEPLLALRLDDRPGKDRPAELVLFVRIDDK